MTKIKTAAKSSSSDGVILERCQQQPKTTTKPTSAADGDECH